MIELPRVKRPCDECPWRVSATPGRFESCRYDALRATAGGPGREAHLNAPIFACHKTPDGTPRACAGWLATVGADHLGMRLAVVTGRLPADAFVPGDDWPELYPSYEAMAGANGSVPS